MTLELSNEVLGEFLNGIGGDDPKIKLILDYIQKTKHRNDQPNEYEDENTKEKNKRLLRSYRLLVERNHLCSSALGMCANCWGTDPSCECCGKGGPGSRTPDIAAFNELVLPALKTMGITVT